MNQEQSNASVRDVMGQLEIAIEALRGIAYPLEQMVRNVKDGERLSDVAPHLASSANYLQGIARDALSKICVYGIEPELSATFNIVVMAHGKGRKFVRATKNPSSHYVYWHEADNAFYWNRGLESFGRLTADDLLANDWMVLLENKAPLPEGD